MAPEVQQASKQCHHSYPYKPLDVGVDSTHGQYLTMHKCCRAGACPAVLGLWYILLITVGVCFVLTLAHNLRKNPDRLARFQRMGSVLWSSGGAGGPHGSTFGSTEGGDHGQQSRASWLSSMPGWRGSVVGKAPSNAAACAHGAKPGRGSVQEEMLVEPGLEQPAGLSRLAGRPGSMEVLEAYWGAGPTTGMPTFQSLFTGKHPDAVRPLVVNTAGEVDQR